MYQVSFENVECFLGYEVRLKVCDDAPDADNNAKGITTHILSSKNKRSKYGTPLKMEVSFLKRVENTG